MAAHTAHRQTTQTAWRKRHLAAKDLPSGQWVSCIVGGNLLVLRADGRASMQLTTSARRPAAIGAQWPPVRDELLVDPGSEKRDLKLFTAANGWREPVMALENAALPAAFAPEGYAISFADRVAGSGMDTGRICRILDRGSATQPHVLLSNAGSGFLVSPASAAGTILFWDDPSFSASEAADGLPLSRLASNGLVAQRLGVTTLTHEDWLSFSPGGDRLAVCAGGGRCTWEEKRIAVIDLRSAAVRFLTDGKIAAISPAWSPGGSAIAYAAAPAALEGPISGGEEARRLLAKRRIWRADPAGNVPPRQLTGDARFRDEAPLWSADGSHLLFGRIAHDHIQTLWLMGADGTGAVPVTEPLYFAPDITGAVDDWSFGYYGHLAWREVVDWHHG